MSVDLYGSTSRVYASKSGSLNYRPVGGKRSCFSIKDDAAFPQLNASTDPEAPMPHNFFSVAHKTTSYVKQGPASKILTSTRGSSSHRPKNRQGCSNERSERAQAITWNSRGSHRTIAISTGEAPSKPPLANISIHFRGHTGWTPPRH